MSAPRVSVLLPVYNSASTLQATLNSMWQQTYKDFELLVVDDGSTDQTAGILARCEDSRLRVIKNPERLRLAGALNRGMQEAAGELIARMDADDLCRPDRLSRQMRYLGAHPEMMLCGTWTRPFGDKRKRQERYPVTTDAIRAFALFNCPFAHPSVMFRRQAFLNENLLYDGSFYPTEDYELWTRVVHGFDCVNLPEVLLDYRVHAKSMTGSDWENMDAQACRLMDHQFRSLGVALDANRIRLHRDIGMARVPSSNLALARDHLADLLTRNQGGAFCQEQAFVNELQERWFHVCMNARGQGADRCMMYRDPAIWRESMPSRIRLGLMNASVLREGKR